MIFAAIEVEALSVNVKSSASQTFIYSSSPHSPVLTLLTTLHTRHRSPLLTNTSSTPQPAADTRNANEVTVKMSERPIFVVSKLDCSSPRWRAAVTNLSQICSKIVVHTEI